MYTKHGQDYFKFEKKYRIFMGKLSAVKTDQFDQKMSDVKPDPVRIEHQGIEIHALVTVIFWQV